MKTKLLLLLVLLLTTSISSLAFQEPQEYKVLFEKAKYSMETKADLQEAINLFESLISSYPDEKEYAAKAQYYIGLCYEKLGLKEAQKAYRKVLDNYPEQTDAVKLANEKLSLLSRDEPVIKKEDKVFNLRQVRADNELYGQGAPSPDGRYISYVHYDTGDLGILEIATGKKRRLTNKGTYAESDEFAEHSRWSPDGKQIVYDWFNKEGFIELRMIGLDGSEPRILYKNEEVDWARTYGWSPDGKQILACFSRKGGAQQIVLVSAEDGSVGVLKILEEGWPKNMNFSPDGHYIVYDFPQKENSSKRDIFLLSTDGSREITLVEHPAHDFLLGWAPDGENIIFASDRTGTLGAWLISVTDGLPQGVPQLVKPDIGLFSTMGFTRDGSFYYHIGGGFIRDVYSATLDPGTGETLVLPKKAIKSFEGHNLSPDYSPDGKSLVYTRRIQDGDVLCIHSLETGEEREFHPKLKQIELPRWSPDGSSILVTGRDLNNSWGMCQIDALTGDVTTIVQNAGGGDWSPDGKDIFYARLNPDKSSQIMVREKESGAEKELYLVSDKGRLSLFCSPDRNWLVFMIWERGVLRVIPANGGEPRELYRLDKGERFGRSIAWTPDGKYIYFVISPKGNSVRKPEQNKCSLWRIPVEGGEPEKLGLEMSQIEHLSVHPDGQRFAFYTITSQVAAVWVMENFLPLEKLAQNTAEATRKAMSNKKIWNEPDTDLGGAPSPDGKYLSYVDWETGDLAIFEIATGKKRRLTNKGTWDESNEFALMSRWSPDGKQIVYDWKNGNDFCELRIIGLDGSKPRILYSNKEVKWIYTYDWSPDGKQILANFDREIGTDMIGQIVLISIADGSERVLKTTPITVSGATGPENLCFSMDGRYIIYDFPQKEGSFERDIFMMSTDGASEISLIEHPAHDEFLGCAPDGKNIIFASDRNGEFSLWSIPIAEGLPQGNALLIKANMGAIGPLGFTRGGSYYYGYSTKNINMYSAELDPETGEILAQPENIITRFEGQNQTPVYSPDGKYFAYISKRFPLTISPDYTIGKLGGNVLCVNSLETGKEREFFPDLERFVYPRWSPDGHSVIVMERNKSGSNKIDIQTGKVTPVLHDDNKGPQPTEISPNGNTIFFVLRDRKTNISKIIAKNLKESTEKEIYRINGSMHIRLSPDGKWLAIQAYYVGYGLSPDKLPSLIVMPSAGGEPQELIRFEDGIDIFAGAPFTWTPDGKYILYTMKSPKKEIEKWDLYRIPVEGGESEKLGMEMSGFITNLSIHPNGRNIAFSITEQSNASIWVMENFLPEGGSTEQGQGRERGQIY